MIIQYYHLYNNKSLNSFFFKIDFIDRDDQKMVSSLYKITQKLSDNQLIVYIWACTDPAVSNALFQVFLILRKLKNWKT